jgi:uncharacterized protein DUF1801
MAENKTRATKASVKSYLAAIKDETRRKDCVTLAAVMTKATKHPPTMWGTSIVGFGSYHYKYESGREGDACLAGFSSRKSDITIYLLADFPKQKQLLARLGKHKMSGSCLHLGTLRDVDLKVLTQLVAAAVAERKERHA